MRYEIWQDRATGERYLVGVESGPAPVVCARLSPSADPRQALEAPRIRRPSEAALARMLRRPDAYRREYTTDGAGRAVLAEDPAARPWEPR